MNLLECLVERFLKLLDRTKHICSIKRKKNYLLYHYNSRWINKSFANKLLKTYFKRR